MTRSSNEIAPAIIVFGVDEKSKPHASYFDDTDSAAATKAAELMGMRVLVVKGGEELAAAVKLPKGRIFASGKAFVPFVSAPVYQRLGELARAADAVCAPEGGVPAYKADKPFIGSPRQAGGASSPTTDATETGDSVATQTRGGRPDWAVTKTGAVVLATVSAGEAWWESVVTAVNDELLTLKWRDFPDDPLFVRHRSMVALLHPSRQSSTGA